MVVVSSDTSRRSQLPLPGIPYSIQHTPPYNGARCLGRVMWLPRSLLFLLIGVIFFVIQSLVSSQVISSPRPQPHPLHAHQTIQCCLLQESFHELMNCVNAVAVASRTSPSPSSPSPPHAAAVVTYVTQSIYEYAAYALAINSAYTEHNHYLYQILTQQDAAYEPSDARWNKVKILENAIDSESGWAKEVPYVVWVDADLAILDLGMKIELIGNQYPDADLIMSEDLDSASTLANSGYILIRNTPWIKTFLSKWWSYDRTRMNDQAALTILYHTLSTEDQSKIIILPKDALNSHFPPHVHQKDYNQVLHLAGDIQAYRRQVFQKGFFEICSAFQKNSSSLPSSTLQTQIPNQLSLSREYLSTSTEMMKGVRILELQQLKSKFLNYSQENSLGNVIVGKHFSFVESILNKALDLQKGALEEFQNIPQEYSERFQHLKYEFYSLEVELLHWCYRSYKSATLLLNSSIPYVTDDNIAEWGLQNREQAESLRQTMSIAYFLIHFHSTYTHELFPSSSAKEIEHLNISNLLKEVLLELEQIILPELQRRIPKSEYARGKYYEFKLYQFMSDQYSQDQNDFQTLLALQKKAVDVWRELHRLKYYGTTYITIDPYKEGSRTIKHLGGLLCFESQNESLYEEGISYYREAQHLMELTIKGFEGNFLAHDGARIDEMYALARLHAEVGSCLSFLTKLQGAMREYQISLDYLAKIEKLEQSNQLGPEMKDFQTRVVNLIRQFSSDPRLPNNKINNKSPQPPSQSSHSVNVEVDPMQGESYQTNMEGVGVTKEATIADKKRSRVFRRKKKELNH